MRQIDVALALEARDLHVEQGGQSSVLTLEGRLVEGAPTPHSDLKLHRALPMALRRLGQHQPDEVAVGVIVLRGLRGFDLEPGGRFCVERRHAPRLLIAVEWTLRLPLRECLKFGAKARSRTGKMLPQPVRQASGRA